MQNKLWKLPPLELRIFIEGRQTEDFWDLFRILPEDSYMYGGERFDREMEPDAEWKDFGSGLWMLPALEVRRKNNYNWRQ
jgi:hypothetical protein